MSDQKAAPLGLHKEEIKKLVKNHTPKGQDALVWYTLVRNKMGVDKQGNKRPPEDVIQFIYVCHRTGLDPIVGQIHAVYRWNSNVGREVMSIQTGIDGARLTAQRSGDYAGQDDIKFMPEEESTPYPIKASCTVYKLVKGQKVAFTATARWAEYAQKDSKGQFMGMWKSNKMPYNQLGKCAEALALRKGFPNELAGIYVEEEMHQANNVLSDLQTPERFDKPAKIEVVHGAPAELGTPEAAKIPKKIEGSGHIVPESERSHIMQPQTSMEPDLAAMRQKLKNKKGGEINMDEPKTVDEQNKEVQDQAPQGGEAPAAPNIGGNEQPAGEPSAPAEPAAPSDQPAQ